MLAFTDDLLCHIFAGDQWLQIDIGPPTLVTAVITKGRGDSRKQHWVKRFMVTYSNDTVRWYNYKDAHHLDPKVWNVDEY